ncbi:hypothetical protein DsansV1_C25g0185931 [Dioscorea sansibarensis]
MAFLSLTVAITVAAGLISGLLRPVCCPHARPHGIPWGVYLSISRAFWKGLLATTSPPSSSRASRGW